MTPRGLDCAPLRVVDDVRLSDADLRRIEPVQRALLSPLDSGTIDDWRRRVNRAVLEVFGSDAAMFQLEAEGVALQLSEEFEPAPISRYTDEYMPAFDSGRNLYQRMLDLGAGNRSMLWGRDLEWLYGSAYFNELVVGLRAFDPLFASAQVEGGQYPAAIHTYHDRRESGCYFDARDVKLMQLLTPALEAGVRAVTRVAGNRASLTASLDAGRDGALVYDLDGRLIYRNAALGRLATTIQDERALGEASGEMARRLASRSMIERLVPSTASRRVSTRTGEFELKAVRLGEGVFMVRSAILVTISAGEAPLPSPKALRNRFGLTRRQAEVALLLAERRTDREVADLLCISPHTARHHAEAVMGKLGVNDRRQIRRKIRRPGRNPASSME